VPATLQFASWLSNNATTNSKVMINMAMEYSSESSNPVDSFATQLLTMVNKINSFITMLQDYSLPAGVRKLRQQMNTFANKSMDAVIEVINKKMSTIVNKSSPVIDKAVGQITGTAGAVASKAGGKLGGVIGRALVEMLGENPTVGKFVGDTHTRTLSSHSILAIKQATNQATNAVRDPMMFVSKGPSLLTAAAARVKQQQKPSIPGLTGPAAGMWETMTDTLTTFSNLLPQAIATISTARETITQMSSNLETIFTTFEVKGPKIFIRLQNYTVFCGPCISCSSLHWRCSCSTMVSGLVAISVDLSHWT